MGSWGGHVLPGAFFLAFSLVWSLRLGVQVRRRAKNEHASPEATLGGSLYQQGVVRIPRTDKALPLLSVLMVICLSIGAYAEFFVYGYGDPWNHLDNAMHTCMYMMFVLSALAELAYFFTQRWGLVPAFVVPLAYAVAFAGVGFLFSAHIMGNPPVDMYLHTMISWLCHALGVVFAVEALLPNNAALAFARSALLFALGTWFVQAAYILYGRTPWDVQSMHLVMAAGILFTMHLACGVAATAVVCAAGFLVMPIVGLADPPRWWNGSSESVAGSGMAADDMEMSVVAHSSAPYTAVSK